MRNHFRHAAVSLTSVLVMSLAIGQPAPAAASSGPTGSATTTFPGAPIDLDVAWRAGPPPANGQIVIRLVRATADAIFVAGDVGASIDGEASFGSPDAFVARYGLDGGLIWARHVGSPGSDTATGLTLSGSALYVGGSSSQFGEEADEGAASFVARLSLDGDRSWQVREPVDQPSPVRLAAAHDGGVVAMLQGATADGPPKVRAAIVRHYRPDGTLAWEDRIAGCCTNLGTSGASPDAIATDPAGVTAVGVKIRPSPSSAEPFVRRYTLGGQLRWETSIAAPAGDVDATQVAANEDATWVIGTSLVPITGAPNAFPAANPFARRLDHAGSAVWTKAVEAHAIQPTCRSFFGIGRISADSGSGANPGAYLARLDAAGDEAWRWEMAGSTTTTVDFDDLSIVGSRAYMVEAVTEGGETSRQILAVSGVPATPGCDSIAPSATAPRRGLVNGTTITGGRVTLRVPWSGTDTGSGIARYELQQQTDSGAWVTVSTVISAATHDRLLAPLHTYRFRVRAVDRAGNVGAWSTGTSFRLSRVSESNAAISYAGRWTTSSSSAYWGGVAKRASASGATASMTFTGRSIAWVSRKGPNRGKAQVLVNGKLVATVDLYASSYQNQRVVWTGSWSSAVSRKVTIRVLGTSRRPWVDFDAFVTAN